MRPPTHRYQLTLFHVSTYWDCADTVVTALAAPPARRLFFNPLEMARSLSLATDRRRVIVATRTAIVRTSYRFHVSATRNPRVVRSSSAA